MAKTSEISLGNFSERVFALNSAFFNGIMTAKRVLLRAERLKCSTFFEFNRQILGLHSASLQPPKKSV